MNDSTSAQFGRFEATSNTRQAPSMPARPPKLGFGAAVVTTVWCAHLLLSPFYFWESGLPQVCDILIVLLFLLLVAFRELRLSSSSWPVLRSVILFAGYSIVVNATWSMVLGEPKLWLPVVYYLFDVVVCVVFLTARDWLGFHLLKWTSVSLFASICIQTLLMLFLPVEQGDRATAFCNDPNQFAYYVVLIGSAFLVCSRLIRQPKLLAMLSPLFYLLVVYLTVMTGSRIGLAAAVLLAVLALTQNVKKAAFSLILILGAFLLGVGTEHFMFTTLRYQEDSTLEEMLYDRGYDRIWEHPEYLLLGSGEGAFERFVSREHPGIEIHSSPGTILFCYGIVGTILFCNIFLVVFKRHGPSALLYLMPVLCFSLALHGLRHSEFWILLMLVSSTKMQQGRRPQSPFPIG